MKLGGPAQGWIRLPESEADGRPLACRIEQGAETVRRIRPLHTEGRNLREIAATLRAEARATKKGVRWAAKTVRKILGRHLAAALGARGTTASTLPTPV